MVIVAGVAVVVPAAVCWGNATTAVKKKENRAMTWRKSILAVFELTGTERKKLSGFVNTVSGAADIRNPGSRAKLGFYITATGLTTDSSFLEPSKFEKSPRCRSPTYVCPVLVERFLIAPKRDKGLSSAHNVTSACNRLMGPLDALLFFSKNMNRKTREGVKIAVLCLVRRSRTSRNQGPRLQRGSALFVSL